MGLEVVGAQAHALRAQKTHGPNVSLIQVVCSHHLTLRCVQGLFVEGHIHPQNMRRSKQTIGMLLEPKNRSAVGSFVRTHPLEYAEPVMERVGQHVNPRLLPGHHFAIEPDVAGEF